VPTTFPMPIPEAIRELLVDLLGRKATVSRIEKPGPADEEEGEEEAAPAAPAATFLATYVADDDTVGVICIADLALSAALGAALTMVPPALVDESIKAGHLAESALLENFQEVVNIMARLFNSNDTPHVRWHTVLQLPDEEVPPGVESLLKRPSARRDLSVTCDGYGSGTLSVLVR